MADASKVVGFVVAETTPSVDVSKISTFTVLEANQFDASKFITYAVLGTPEMFLSKFITYAVLDVGGFEADLTESVAATDVVSATFGATGGFGQTSVTVITT